MKSEKVPTCLLAEETELCQVVILIKVKRISEPLIVNGSKIGPFAERPCNSVFNEPGKKLFPLDSMIRPKKK